MSVFLVLSIPLRRSVNRIICPSICNAALPKNFGNFVYGQRYLCSYLGVIRSQELILNTPRRFKYTKKDEDSSDEDEDEVETVEDVGHDFKVLKIRVNSLRADLILKAALGMARNKIETAFYQSRIRVNGLKLLKKSAQLKVEDEIDLIRGTSKLNTDFLVVSRVKILSYTPKDEKYAVFVQCFRSLTIENYSKDPFKMSESN